MNYRFVWGVLLVAALGSFGGCKSGKHAERKQMRQYSKGTISQRDTAAFYYFEHKDYEIASLMLEELLSIHRADTLRQRILYTLAQSKYQLSLYPVAAQYFEQYATQYNNGKYAEEASFMAAQSYYKQSDPYYLDQHYSQEAIKQLQLFIGTYPQSPNVAASEKLIKELSDKLIYKDFQQGMLYYNIGDYKGAIQIFANVIQEYPDGYLREDATFYQFMAMAKLAHESITTKKKNRYLDSIDAYKTFVKRYPDSKFKREADVAHARAQRELAKFTETNPS